LKSQAQKRVVAEWKLGTRTLELGARTLVMGVVNITPDSFSDGGSFIEAEVAVAHALQLLEEGAHLLDLGAESTRPGANVASGTVAAAGSGMLVPPVSAEEEQARLLPVLEGVLKARPDALISVDTYKAATARAALTAGAEIINDVSGLHWDHAMGRVCAEAVCGVVLMYTRGTPAEWSAQAKLEPDGLLETVRAGLQDSLDLAAAAGIDSRSVVVDPGYGFGKGGSENFALLARQAELLSLGRPLLAGVSRKSFLGAALAPLFKGKKAPVDGRDEASLAAMVAAILKGASIVRVHRVRPAVEAALVIDALMRESDERQ
jgi:dihydropteroate synthase